MGDSLTIIAVCVVVVLAVAMIIAAIFVPLDMIMPAGG